MIPELNGLSVLKYFFWVGKVSLYIWQYESGLNLGWAESGLTSVTLNQSPVRCPVFLATISDVNRKPTS